MTKRMLIDAGHPEETRVVVLSGNRLDEFDLESATKRQLKGNIYLAKVTRVEPSLQAAFVEYGGNRHGFLPFGEIHPDYYQIPIADREALAAEERAETARRAEEPEAPVERAEAVEGEEENGAAETPEEVGGDAADEAPRRRFVPSRHYRIQEVVKRRQIMLVQVVKEERGTKGAALTTYLSLAGRYCVLMPNTARGGGISRKIVDLEDRKRLKAIAAELAVPEGMGVILRTAGMNRSKAEIKRDFTYLLKLWDSIRERTLESVAPALIHEEANLIKRTLRDIYSREIEEVLVAGDEGYRMAKEFMRQLIPSHARRVKEYTGHVPLFHRFQVEGQLDAIHNPIVHLKSGGYLVLSQTEALVAIDVNSGRSTRERNIEATALKTNVEAADEIARQLRLRDLAGLIVIDFIDMDENRNVRAVERRFKEAVKGDRARIQVGRISAFGLLEMSRQRLHPSLIEASSLVCPYCSGSGHIRSTESSALHVLRAIEEEGIRGRSAEVTVAVPTPVALYILNQKRAEVGRIETHYGLRIAVAADDTLIPPDYRLERVKAETGEAEVVEAAETAPEGAAETAPRKRRRRGGRRAAAETPAEAAEPAGEVAEEAAETEEAAAEAREGTARRRRRGRRGGRRRRTSEAPAAEATAGETAETGGQAAAASLEAPAEAQAVEGPVETEAPAEPPPEAAPVEAPAVPALGAPTGEVAAPSGPAEAPPLEAAPGETAPEAAVEAAAEAEPAAKPKRRRTRRKPKAAEAPAEATAAPEAPAEPAVAEAAEVKPKRRRAPRRKAAAKPPAESTGKKPATPGTEPPTPGTEPAPAAEPGPLPVAAAAPTNGGGTPAPEAPRTAEHEPQKAARRGWWQRLLS